MFLDLLSTFLLHKLAVSKLWGFYTKTSKIQEISQLYILQVKGLYPKLIIIILEKTYYHFLLSRFITD